MHNDQITQMFLGLEELKKQGMDTRDLESLIRQQQSKSQPNSMSTTDGVYITQSTPDAPGAYVDADQQNQDAYATALAMANQRSESPALMSDMNTPVNPIMSPHYQVAQTTQHVAIGPNGQIIRY